MVVPSETLACLRPLRREWGSHGSAISRVSTASASRFVVAVPPNSRPYRSRREGAGPDPGDDLALMEAIEGFHAEEVGKSLACRLSRPCPERGVIDPLALCTTGRPFDLDAAISWLQGFRSAGQEPCSGAGRDRPHRLSRPLDGISPARTGWHRAITSRGDQLRRCASRSSETPWRCGVGQGLAQEPCGRSTSHPIDDPISTRFWPNTTTGIVVQLCNVTTDIGIAAFVCDIRDRPETSPADCAASTARMPSRSGDRLDSRADRGSAVSPHIYRGDSR